MKRELLLVLKTNSYLRAIDVRMGNPVNTFTQINDVTWEIFKKEMSGDLTNMEYLREMSRYYMLKFGFFLHYMSVTVRSLLGYKIDEEELEDFEMEKLKF